MVAGGMTADEFYVAAGAVQPVSEEAKERFVGGGIHRGSGDSDAQFVADCLADLIQQAPLYSYPLL